MDESLLRRLLGAAALLALAFLVASLLPEPQPAGRGGTVVYDLRTGAEVDSGTRAPVENPPELKSEDMLAPPPAAPAPPLEGATAPPVERRPALKVDETLGQPGGWFIQVASFASEGNARKALQELYGIGLKDTVIQMVKVPPKTWYRVRVGPFPSEGMARAPLGRIKQAGYTDAKLVPPETDPAPKRN